MSAAAMPETGSYRHYAGWVPQGHQWNMIAASLFKRFLQGKMDAGLRLRILEGLNSMADIYLRPEMVAMIEPMCDTGYEIWKEATTLDRDGDKACMASFRVLTSPRVFNHFVALNPSIFAAIKWREEYRGNVARQVEQSQDKPASEQTTAPPPDEELRYGVHNVPTEIVGPASIYQGNYPGIPDRFFDPAESPRFAIGTPSNKPMDPFTGR